MLSRALTRFNVQQQRFALAAVGLRSQATPVVQFNARHFGLTKYKFDDEDWEASIYQKSMVTHGTNAEELINNLPIVEVHGGSVRCTGVHEYGLGHPVQYIVVDKRHHNTPTTCKWCGLRFRKA